MQDGVPHAQWCQGEKYMKVELERMRAGECVYHGMRGHYKHVIITFQSVIGKKQKETTFTINISSMSSTILNSANCEEDLDWYVGLCSYYV